ncbi:anthranilate synthase component I [Brevibacillus fulvus]|uniref:Anthranilate synthase component 1 n=1 Tax=Brevibacillus fulvus TaxID=1125967 RepID=A0A938XW01_9BACL|nr:anthranilate synthase component I [Brevibacillus fulvus]MBM7588718.1 anthranilate synthase component 1 [Brevibacillus fulvus]
MFYPSLPEVQTLAADYSLIPVRMSLLADQETPISLYQKFRQNDSFLLESVEGGTQWARYSFIGIQPFLRIEAKDSQITVTDRMGKAEQLIGNPILYLREQIDRYRSPKLADFPRLTGGAVGFFGYNTLHYFEDLPLHRQEAFDVPDLRFLLVDELIAYDHLKQEIQIIVNLLVEAGDSEADIRNKYEAVCQRISELARQTRMPNPVSPLPLLDQRGATPQLRVKPNMEQAAFEQMVEKAKEYIAAGDIFQVVLSQRFSVETELDPFSVYRVLRTLNPSPYMYFLQYGNETIAGTSPEVLVRVEDGKVEMRPIAGTRKRGKDAAEDLALAHEMLHDPKERAEHFMLLDLGRNDVGRVSEYGTVIVEEQMVLEHYSHVMHLVSHVSGKLRADLHPFDAFLSAFPAGTVSGAPKLRAMEIIAELEPDARHTYAGSIGYISFTGNLDSCITIRTILFKDGQAHIQAGAGIVADSSPRLEYKETVNKASAMIRALEKAEQLFAQKEEYHA